ncbi:MAG: hypothetical protein WD988_03020 [Candidatus Curtissbacteria bacterium]
MINFKLPEKFLLVLTILTVPLVLAGCFPGIGQTNTVGRDEYIAGAVVPGFPQVPLYPDASVIESYGFEEKYGASIVADDDVARVARFYSDSLPQLLWQTDASGSGDRFIFNIKNENQEGMIIVNKAADGKTTAITIAISPRAN